MLRLVLAAIVAVGAFLVYSVRAEASPYVQYGIQDDAWLLGGPGAYEERLERVERLGVDVVRVNLRWNEIAARKPAKPTSHLDPAYRWNAADVLLNGLRAHGIAPVVSLIGTPRWANGGRAPNWAPRSASSFANFAAAAATRYPFVRHWVIWNEPNKYWQLRPTSPKTYVRLLLNPAYAAIKRVAPRDAVAGGVTAPRGGRGSVSPVSWIRGMRAARCTARRVRAPPVPRRPRGDAVQRRRLRALRRPDDGVARPPRRRGHARVRPEAHLADRVRLPDEPARPVARRLAGGAGALPRRGGPARVSHAACRHADPLPRARRVRGRALAERPLHVRERAEALGVGVPASARPGLSARRGRDALGSGATRSAAARPTGCARRAAGSARPAGRARAATSRRPCGCRAARASASGPAARTAYLCACARRRARRARSPRRRRRSAARPSASTRTRVPRRDRDPARACTGRAEAPAGAGCRLCPPSLRRRARRRARGPRSPAGK